MDDVKHREDIAKIVDAFYQTAMQDKEIGYIFTEVAQLNLKEHIPTICDFWETVLFGNMVYRGSVVSKHMDLHRKSNLDPAHFTVWLGIWEKTVNSLFAGEKASEMIHRAGMMAEMMKHKINYLNHNPGMIL